MTHVDLINAKGTAAIASATGRPPAHIRAWKSRRVIPHSAYADILVAFPDVTLEMLKAGRPA